MAYECKGPECPNFTGVVQYLADTTTTGAGEIYFDAEKDAAELTPIAREVCKAKFSGLSHLVEIENEDCAFEVDQEFQADPNRLIDAIVSRDA